MLISGNCVYSFGFRPYWLCGNNSLILVSSKEGRIATIGLQSGQKSGLSIEKPISDVSFSVSQNIIALAGGINGHLILLDFEGNVLHEEEPPRFGWDHSTIFERGFPAVYFDRSESVFWCVIRTHNEKFEIQLRAADARTVLDRIETEDPFGDSLFSFHPTNNENLVALWIAAGQDGQTIHWLESDGGRIIHRPEDAFLETTPPAFAPDGSEFLILDGEGRIARYRYPTAKIADCPWPFGDEDCFAGYMAYIDQTSAIVISNNGRTFLLDVPTMTIADEIVIENHPPRPVPRIYYPSRYVDELCTDLRFFERIGDNFLFVYEDSLLVVPAAEFLSAPRPHK